MDESMEKGKLIAEGNTAQIYEYGPDMILKLYRGGMPDEACKREFYITQNVCKFLIFCPKAFEIIQIDNRIGAVYERINGKTMLEIMLSKFWSVNSQSKLLAHYHQEIHKEVHFDIPTVKEKLKNDIRVVSKLPQHEKEILYDYLNKLPDGNTLCHFDFHPGNIMINDGNVKIIDWMTACIGDEASDVARTCIMLKYSQGPNETPRSKKKLIKIFQKKLYTNYLSEYLKISTLNIHDIERWECVVAAARLNEWLPESEKQTLLNFVQKFISNKLALQS